MQNCYSSLLVKVSATGLAVILYLSPYQTAAQSQFHKAIGMESFEKGSAVKILPDGGLIISGETENPAAQERDMMLMQTDSNGNLVWINTYGGPERETVNDVIQTIGGFVMVAEKYQPNKQEGENMTLIKTDDHGRLLWTKLFDEGGNETEGFSMQATREGGFVIAGMTKSMNMVSSAFFTMSSEDQGLYLLKTDGNGNKLWSRKFDYGESGVSSTGTSVFIAKDGTYMVAGNIAKQGRTDKKIDKPALKVNMQDLRNMLLVKVKPNGTLQWAREYVSNTMTMAYTVIEKREGGFLVVGNTNTTKENLDIFLMCAEADGSVQWAKTFGGPKFESVADVVQTPDGGFVISGVTESFGSGSMDVLTFKTDGKGGLQWAKTYGGRSEDYPSRMAITRNGIVTVGATASYKSESFDVLLMKSDWAGNCGSFGKDVTLVKNDILPVARKIAKPAMKEVVQGVFPPNMKKPDVKNIVENKREARIKILGD